MMTSDDSCDHFERIRADTPPGSFPAWEVVAIDYTNHRGERSWRTVIPMAVRFAEDRWHPGAQWLLDAIDGRKGLRTFAMKDVHRWVPAPGRSPSDVGPPPEADGPADYRCQACRDGRIAPAVIHPVEAPAFVACPECGRTAFGPDGTPGPLTGPDPVRCPKDIES